MTRVHLGGERGEPCTALDTLAGHSAGLECLTGCRRGRVAAAILRGDEVGARAALDDLCAIFGPAHVWVEAQRGGLPDDAKLLHGLARLARAAGVGIAATGNAHYACPGDRDLQDALVAIRQRLPLERARRHLRPGASWHLRAPGEMAALFRDLPEALAGAAALAGRCGFELGHIDAALPAFPAPEGHTAASYLRHLVSEGARERYGAEATTEAVRTRLAHELDVIERLGLADYFLIVWDIMRYARERGLLCQARGSAVGSAVAYALGISAVEPLAHGLLFERFLAAGRDDPPDIDLDLPSDRPGMEPARGAVIAYVLARYAGHAALVDNVVTYQRRSAIRDVGLALGLAPAQIDALATDAEGTGRGITRIQERRDASPGGMPRANQAGMLDLPSGRVLARLRELCARLEGLPRHLSQHAGGVVLTARPLAEVVPLERAAMPGRLIAQWDKDACEAAGLVKIDLLGLGILAAIDRAFGLIAAETGTRPELHSFRCDDPAVYDLFCRADTVGVFQLESRAQIAADLPQLQPRCYEDLAAAVALIRPGPIQGGATHPFLRRRRGLEPVTYPGGDAGRRLLAPILAETYGTVLYQDQILALAMACGLSGGEAAELRRAMSSARSKERMAALCGRLDAGLAAHGLDAQARAAVLVTVAAFSGYGFVKGHACAFGYLAYVSGWLKVYHPAAFLAGLLDAQPLGFYPPETLMQDAAHRGVRVLPVDVRRSRAGCTLEDGAVRLGLRQVRGLGADACARVEAACTAAPPTLDELCLRARLEEDEARALARAGALRGYIAERRRAMWEAPPVARAARERWLPGVRAAADPPATLPDATPVEDMALERAALGYAPGHHVLAPLRRELATVEGAELAEGGSCVVCRSGDLGRLRSGTRVALAGQVHSRQAPETAHGMLFLGLSDEEGLLNVAVPPDVRTRDRAAARGEALLWVEGVVERRGGAPAVRATRLRPLGDMLRERAF